MILTPFLLASVAAAAPAEDVAPTMPIEVQAPGFFEGWTGSWNVGATYTDGNTSVQSYNVNFDAERKVGENRWTATAFWNYSTDNNQANSLLARNAFGQLKYDRFLNEKTYVWVDATAFTDEIALLDLRYTVGGGVGHQFIDMGVDADGNKITKPGEIDTLRGEIGLTYFNEEFDEVSGTPDNDYIAARAMVDFGMDLTETTRLENTTTVFPSLEDSEDFYGIADTRVKMKVSENMFAQMQWIMQYDNAPAAGVEREDHRVVAGLGWNF